MEAEIVLNLLDSYWYDLDFFKRSTPIKTSKIPEMPSSNSDIPILPTIYTKSSSSSVLEKMCSNNSKLSVSDSSFSPNSVLSTPKLQTIFSGKVAKEHENTAQKVNNSCSPMKDNVGNSRIRKKRGLSKSLSDLEFEELKGFMDLGFVFSEEDKDSTLASIIPGLQRLRNSPIIDDNINNNNKNVIIDDKIVSKSGVSKSAGVEVQRPYLSEAWQVFEKKKKENSVLNWKVPAATSQIDMKGYLRFWAHTVASTVKS